MKCCDCLFFRLKPDYLVPEQLVGTGVGECRRHAPIKIAQVALPVDPDGITSKASVFVSGVGSWPIVHALFGGCGEYEPGDGGPHNYWTCTD